MKIISFEKLDVWQKSKSLAVEIYKIIRSFPDEEKYGLVSQMRRSVVSISSNIAEGNGSHNSKDKARFSKIAYSSKLELLNQSILSHDLGFIKVDKYKMIRSEVSEITAMLDGLRKSQLANS